MLTHIPWQHFFFTKKQPMSLFSKIRISYFDAHLNKKIAQTPSQNRLSVEFSAAKSIGILFDATDASSRTRVLDYAQDLINNGKKVNLLGFVKTKQKDLNFPFKFFTLQNVSWKMIPESATINEFLSKKFDILISLYLPTPKTKLINKPLEYISALSKANLRVGPFCENTNSYDLIIDTPKNANLEYLIKQVEFFLYRINVEKEVLPI